MSAINAVSVLGQLGQNLKVATLKSGSQSASLVPKKEFGIAHGLKGAALNKAHYEYKRDQMSSNAKVIGAALIEGSIGVTRVGANAKGTGGSIGWKLMSTLKAPAEKSPELSKLTDDQILDEMVRRGITTA